MDTQNVSAYFWAAFLFAWRRMSEVAIKAVGDWELEVRAIPYGMDKDGQTFDAGTDFMLDTFNSPLIVYQHGFTRRGQPQSRPEVIGKALTVERRADGIWVRVLLDRTKALAGRVMQAVRDKLAVASSGSIDHLARMIRDGVETFYSKDAPGRITVWPFAELSLWDRSSDNYSPASHHALAYPVIKALYAEAGMDWPALDDPETAGGAGTDLAAVGATPGQPEKAPHKQNRSMKMSDKTYDAADIEAAKKAARAELEAEIAAEQKRQAEIAANTEAAIKAARVEWEAEQKAAADEAEKAAAKNRRLPENIQQTQFGELSKYDHLSVEDQAVLVGVLNSPGAKPEGSRRASESAVKALAVKLSEATKESEAAVRRVGIVGSSAMKMAGIKADEIMQQDLTGFGDEWVGVGYSQAIWERIRETTFVADKLPSFEVPPGHESWKIPLEGADPTFYKVAEATDTAASGWPNATVPSSRMATGVGTLTLAKMGARVLWSGEMEEDSLIPFVAQLRMQLVKAGAEQFEHAIIDGDTATGATTNINDIGGTPGANDLYLLFNGFRKSPLVTTTDNSRDGGTLTIEDYLATVKLMGASGINALQKSGVSFIVDVNTYWKTLELEEVRTKDVFSQPTIENGDLVGLWGYALYRSAFMHYMDSDRLANAAGKVDQDTVSNNSKGAILAVRWDQWLLGYRRRMTLETTRIARADTTEIVALMRAGLTQRDTEASAITYNITI